MGNNHFWLSITALAALFDHGQVGSEETLNRLEREVMSLSRDERRSLRQQMVIIVGALSRLEIRLVDADGPLGSSL